MTERTSLNDIPWMDRENSILQNISLKPLIIWLVGVGFLTLGAQSSALAPTAAQSDTLKEIIDVIEDRHYASRRYDDGLSAQHFTAYLDALDPQRMFFEADDIAAFSQWQLTLDNAGRAGDLAPAFTIFNNFHDELKDRLTEILETLPQTLGSFDYEVEEYLEIDRSAMPWAKNEIELDERWRKRLKNQALSLLLAEKAPAEIPETLERRYQNQLKRLAQYNAQDVFQIYANTLAEQYDPHTNYFSPRRAENFDINMSLSFEGIGAILQIDDEYAKVTRLVPAGPADKQGGLRPSDLIMGVGQGETGPIEDVIGWRLDEIVDLIRGPRDTTVRLEVIPDKGKTDQRRVVPIRRNEVKLEEQAAQKEIIEFTDEEDQTHRVGVIDIPAFYIDFEAYRQGDKLYRSTTRDVKKLVDELVAEGVEGIVIDLRDNGGGSLQEANQLTGLFIEYGPTVQIRSAESRVWRDGKRRRSQYYEGPLAVMINRLSASASEIFAGAIQDYGRGIIVGEQSFGKGTVQSLVPLQEGQLKITESKFYRVSGGSTQHRGVVPDIDYPSLFDPEKIGESALDNALAWDQIAPTRFNRYNNYDTIIPTLASMHNARAANDPDYQFLQDQVEMAQDARAISALPLQQSGRIAMRDEQEALALAIENKRRLSKGLEPLATLDTDDEIAADAPIVSNEETALPQNTPVETGDDEEATPDVLLLETGKILVDSISLRPRDIVASRVAPES
jgi:carboxyl-terminal processing protease